MRKSGLTRFGLESIYAILGAAPGTPLNHFDVIHHLVVTCNASFESPRNKNIPLPSSVNGSSATCSALAAQLVGLQQRLAERGVPERILHMPAVGLVYLEDRLQNWKLL